MAFLKETQRSLHWYFIIIGLFSVLMGLSFLDDIGDVRRAAMDVPGDWMFAMYFSCVARLGIGVAYVYTGARLNKDLLDGGRATRIVLKIALALIVTDVVLVAGVLGSAAVESALGSRVFSVAVTLYLLHNVTRLVREARDKAGIPPEPPRARAL